MNISQSIPCPVCGEPLDVRIAHGRKSGKVSIMLVCARDGRHFRGFIADREYVKQVLDLLESK